MDPHLTRGREEERHQHSVPPVLQQLVDDRVEQGHVLRPLDGQLVDGVMLDHLRYTGEGVAELAQDEATLAGGDDLHVHEAAGTPTRKKERN